MDNEKIIQDHTGTGDNVKEKYEENRSINVERVDSGIMISGDNCIVNTTSEKVYNVNVDIFKKYYLKAFSTIQLPIADERKQTEDIFINLAIIKEKVEDISEKEKILNRDKHISSFEEIYKPKESIDLTDLIKESRGKDSVKALIYGKAGIGKTTLCYYIAYQWAKNKLYEEFENIIYIPLREWKSITLEPLANSTTQPK